MRIVQQVVMVPMERIHESPTNPRTEYGDLSGLISTIKSKGFTQSITVRPTVSGFEIVHGHRRYRAAKALVLLEIPCIVRERKDADLTALQLIDNIQHEDLSAIDQAKAYQRLIKKFGWTHVRLAAELGISQATVSNKLKLLTLPQTLQTKIAGGEVSATNAELMTRLKPGDRHKMEPYLAQPFDVAMNQCRKLQVESGTLGAPRGKAGRVRSRMPQSFCALSEIMKDETLWKDEDALAAVQRCFDHLSMICETAHRKSA